MSKALYIKLPQIVSIFFCTYSALGYAQNSLLDTSVPAATPVASAPTAPVSSSASVKADSTPNTPSDISSICTTLIASAGTTGVVPQECLMAPTIKTVSTPATTIAMINLPPIPGVEINQAKVNSYITKTEQIQNIEEKAEAYKKLTPWANKEVFGSPKDQNYQDLMKQQFPLSPEQIKLFRQISNSYEQSVQDQVRNPTPIMSTRAVNLDPGSTPPPVRISTGYVSTLLFLDETGAPWPIKAYDIGNPTAFSIQWDKESNLMMVQGLVPYANTNIVVLLHGLDTPVILNFVNDQKKVDYRLDLRIAGLGPKAATPMIKSNIPATDNSILMSLLDGIPPEQAKPIQVSGGTASVWLFGDSELLIRTRLTVLSPSYTSSMRSADGMKVYRMPKTPVIMASKDGNTYQLAVEGY